MLNEVAGDYMPSSMAKVTTKPQKQKPQDVDDLLDFIDNTTSVPQQKSKQRPQTSQPSQAQYQNTADNFFNDFEDNIVQDDYIPVVASLRRNRPDTAQPTSSNMTDENAKNKIAELFGVKPGPQILNRIASQDNESKQTSGDEINTLDIVSSRRNRRVISKKDDQDSFNKSKDLPSNLAQDDYGSAIDDYSDIGALTSKSRMRPPLNKKSPQAQNSLSFGKPPPQNRVQDNYQSKMDLDSSPTNENFIKQDFKSFNDIGGERSFDKMSGSINHDDSALTNPQLMKQIFPKNNYQKASEDGISHSAHEQMVKALQKQIDYLEQQNKDLKKDKEESISQLQAMHTISLEGERKSRVEIVNQLQEMMEKERKRMTEQYEQEIDRLRRDADLDKQRALELAKHEPSTMKQQIESQYKLNELADQLKSHSSNLSSLQKQIEHNTNLSQSEKEHSFSVREQYVVELERKLQIDLNLLEQEKLKISHINDDLKQRQFNLENQIEIEKSAIRSEFKRLGEMQEQIRSMEGQSRKFLGLEKDSLNQQKSELDKQQNELNHEYMQKLKHLDIERDAYERQKEQFRDFSNKNNEMFKRKFEEMDLGHEKLASKETELIYKQRQTDLKEHEVSKMHNELNRKIQLLDQERADLHYKVKEITDKEMRMTSDMMGVNDVRHTNQGQKDEMDRKRQELALKEKKLNQEKQVVDQEKHQLNLMHQTLSNMRSDIASNSMANTGFAQTKPEIMSRPMVLTSTNFNNQSEVSNKQQQMKPKIKAERQKTQDSKQFDVGNYVNFLKKVDSSTSHNQTYHLKERGQFIQSNGFNESKY